MEHDSNDGTICVRFVEWMAMACASLVSTYDFTEATEPTNCTRPEQLDGQDWRCSLRHVYHIRCELHSMCIYLVTYTCLSINGVCFDRYMIYITDLDIICCKRYLPADVCQPFYVMRFISRYVRTPCPWYVTCDGSCEDVLDTGLE